MTPNRILRYVYLAGFFVALPLAMAALVVWLVAPGDAYVGTGAFGWMLSVFRDQRVPVAIVLFTIFEVVLWNRRHQLPFADLLGSDRRGDVPPRYRADFERAAALLDEAERINRRESRRIERDLTPDDRDALTSSLDELRDAMRADPFRGDEFGRALLRAETEVDGRLGRWRKGELREYTESIGVAVAVALLLRVFVVEAFKIPSGSMIPTLQIGDHIFVNKMSYGALIPWTKTRLFPRMPPKRADVMVFEFPENREQDFIKRTIALPGDRLEVKDGHPIINGWKVPFCNVGTYSYKETETSAPRKAELDVEYLEDKAYLTVYERQGAWSGELQGPYFVKPGEVWVLGDNRNNSHDSRGWFEGKGGGVPFENIKGRAMFVWLSVEGTGHWAWERIGVSVMGMPKLPPALVPTLQAGIDKCYAQRPPLAQTTPPPPAPLVVSTQPLFSIEGEIDMRASMVVVGVFAVVVLGGCKKSEDPATTTASGASSTVVNITGLNGAQATATTTDGLTRYSDEGPEIGTVFTKGPGIVRAGADQTSAILTHLGPNTAVNKKARRGPYFLVDYPSGPGTLKPGWIEQDQVTGTPAITPPAVTTVVPPAATPVVTATAGHPPIRIKH